MQQKVLVQHDKQELLTWWFCEADGEQQNNQSKFIDWWVVEHAQQVLAV